VNQWVRRTRASLVIRILLALVAVGVMPVALPAAAHADTGPDKVTVGVFINDLQDIDLASENFTVDFYLWMRWKNPAIDPSLTIEAMNSEGTQNTTSSPTGGYRGNRCTTHRWICRTDPNIRRCGSRVCSAER